MHPIIILLLLVGGLLFASWCKRQPPEVRTKALVYAAILVILLLVVSGRMHWLMGVIGAGIALFQRVMMATKLFDQFKSMGTPTPGHKSSLKTRFFDMSLDHESGNLSGKVSMGRFQGSVLSALGLDELLDLLAECRAEDHQSAVVLESYLEQRFGDHWRGRGNSGSGASNLADRSGMTRQEASQILGVTPDASKDEVIQAHRRLMQRLHPDRGGSTYLAAKINQAKDLLTGV